MACAPVCKLCPNLIISQSVTFTGGNVVINIPAGSYNAGEKYCIVIAQTIPTTATISAPVVITIGSGAEQYPLNSRRGVQITAAGIRTRTKYAVIVSTNATGGSFNLIGNAAPCPTNNLPAIDGTAPTA